MAQHRIALTSIVNTWSLFVAQNLDRAWVCFAATRHTPPIPVPASGSQIIVLPVLTTTDPDSADHIAREFHLQSSYRWLYGNCEMFQRMVATQLLNHTYLGKLQLLIAADIAYYSDWYACVPCCFNIATRFRFMTFYITIFLSRQTLYSSVLQQRISNPEVFGNVRKNRIDINRLGSV